jgi:hypothetical protein
MKLHSTLRLGLLLLGAAASARAGVGPELAARLGNGLTPLGGTRAGNAAGTIPSWSGDAAIGSPPVDSQPLLVVTKENAARYGAELSDGQRALLDRLPESYGLPVYPSRRQAGAPTAFNAGTLQNATRAFLDGTTPAPQNAIGGIPFPILSPPPTEAGLEAIWNHRLRWRGLSRTRRLTQITSSTRGDLGVSQVLERLRFQSIDSPPVDHYGTILTYVLRGVIEPKRLAGTVKLIDEPLQGMTAAWQRGPNQLHFDKTSSAGDDTPVIGTDGLFDEDQFEGFSGPPVRYDWKLLGTRELLVPYDAEHFDGAAPDDIFGPRHIRPTLAHYELHRVRVVEARLKPALIAPFTRRVFYLDEDSWQVLMVDLYDRSDTLVRVQEVHTRVGEQAALVPTLETVYDLPGKRYFGAAMTNRDGRVDFTEIPVDEFRPGHAVPWARRAGVVPADDRGEL